MSHTSSPHRRPPLSAWRLFFSLSLTLFALGATARATDYFVDSQATGTDVGTSANPWKSIAKVNAHGPFNAGDRILFKRDRTFTGTTLTVNTQTLTSEAQRVIYGSYSGTNSYPGTGAKPIINMNSAEASGIIVNGRRWITIENLDVRNVGVPGPNSNVAAVKFDNIQNVKVLGVNVTTGSGAGLKFTQGGWVTVDGCTISETDQGAIYFTGSDVEPLHDVTISNCVVTNLNGAADGITLHDSGYSSATNSFSHLGSNFTLTDNDVSGANENGYDITSGSNITLSDNISHSNTAGSMSMGHNASNIKVRYHRSYSEPTGTGGANLKISANNVLIEYSTVVGNTSGSSPLVMITPTLDNSGEINPNGYADSQPENVVIRNNVFMWNSASSDDAFAMITSNASNVGNNIGTTFNPTIQWLTMKNNIWGNLSSGIPKMNFSIANRPPDFNVSGNTRFVIVNNLYDPTIDWVVNGKAGSPFTTFTAYHNAYPFAGEISGNPGFVSASDFHLASTSSPAYNTGTSVIRTDTTPDEAAMLTTDFGGVATPQGVRDMGAYELPVGGSAPAAPSGLTASAPTSSTITLNWNDNSSPPNGETGFEIDRATNSAFTTGPAPITNTYAAGTNATGVTATGLSPSTLYYFRVRATNGLDSPNSNTASLQTAAGGGTLATYTSTATLDGWVLESGENTGVGGSINSTLATPAALLVGDDATKKQYKAILSFDTGPLPDGATILSATLKLKRGAQNGTVTALGTLRADAKNFNFGNAALEAGDFSAAATVTQAATLNVPTTNGALATGNLTATGLTAINTTGKTQFRVYFSVDDNNNPTADNIGFYSGDDATEANRPVLEVTYQ